MMDNPKVSFIPKQAIRSIPGRVSHRRRHFNPVSFIGSVVFLCGMVLAVGVFLYEDFSEKDLLDKKEQLQAIKNSFSQVDIEVLRELDRRLVVARTLLDAHLSPSVVFDALELRTQRDVSFTDFSYERKESSSVEVVLEGTALRFNTVALQSRELADAAVLARTVFSGLSVGETGTVHFTATSEGNAAALAYTVPVTAASPAEENATTTEAAADTDAVLNNSAPDVQAP